MSPDDFETVPLAEVLLRGSRRHPDRDCIVVGDERVTYSELAARAGMVGRSLIALGIERGDRVGILMANGLDFTDLLFGTSLIGAIPVLYNARFKAREIAHVTADAGIKVVVTNNTVEDHTDYVELLNKAEVQKAPSMQHQIFLGAGHSEGFMDRDTFCGVAESVDPGEVKKRHAGTAITDTALMFYTSGTTAMPKGCPLDHIVLQHAGVVGGTDRLRLIEGDVVWNPLPMFHSAFTQPLTGTPHFGGTLVSMAHFAPEAALNLITSERVTVAFPAFPTITLQLLHHPRYTPETLSGVRVILNVGPPEELGAMQALMPYTTQITCFGMSECGGSVAMCNPDDPLPLRSECSGKALPGIDIEVRDPETGKTLASGEPGEIVARGRSVFSGYYNDPEKTEAAFWEGGWFRTGDLGVLDAEGRVTFRGRLKDMLKVGGENVAAVEIEGYLALHPAVKLAQVVGLPDEKYGEVPVAFIELVPEATATEAEMITFCRGEIASFKIPRQVRFIEEWPMGATKILKSTLRDQLLAEMAPV